MMNGSIHWHHVVVAMLVIMGVAVLFSLETGKPVNAEGITVDATSVLILGG